MENRNGLVVSAVVAHADGFGERRAALAMLDALPGTGAAEASAPTKRTTPRTLWLRVAC